MNLRLGYRPSPIRYSWGATALLTGVEPRVAEPGADLALLGVNLGSVTSADFVWTAVGGVSGKGRRARRHACVARVCVCLESLGAAPTRPAQVVGCVAGRRLGRHRAQACMPALRQQRRRYQQAGSGARVRDSASHRYAQHRCPPLSCPVPRVGRPRHQGRRVRRQQDQRLGLDMRPAGRRARGSLPRRAAQRQRRRQPGGHPWSRCGRACPLERRLHARMSMDLQGLLQRQRASERVCATRSGAALLPLYS
jgi:hypothetical protein